MVFPQPIRVQKIRPTTGGKENDRGIEETPPSFRLAGLLEALEGYLNRTLIRQVLEALDLDNLTVVFSEELHVLLVVSDESENNRLFGHRGTFGNEACVYNNFTVLLK